MKIMTPEETRRICDKVMSLTKADECTVTINGGRTGNIRYARNNVSTHAAWWSRTSWACRSPMATSRASRPSPSSTTSRSKKSCAWPSSWPSWRRKTRNSCLAVQKQAYKETATFNKKTAAIDPDFRAQTAAYSIEASRKNKLIAVASLPTIPRSAPSPILNGVFGHQESTGVEFTCTVRTEDGRGSGWVKRSATDVSKFDA
ncbi:hypothetical protein LP420_17490 [Massilia sp. B-10]|nr:hypothetical protein LP420_17490 [Massilia sp. B-10]